MEGEHPEGGPGAAESPALPVRLDPPPVDCDVTAVKNLDPTTVDCEVTVAETTVGCDVTVAESTVDCNVTVAESTVDCDVIVAESPVDCDVTVVVTPDPPTVDNGVIALESCTVPPARQQSSGADPNAGTPQRSREPPPTKLCGYLHKLGGPLKSWKCRWFVYEEEKCQLFYYRTPQDVNPLGRIQLADATFGYPIQADEGTFHIQTPERKFVLKAVHREAMMYWLQQLQLRRWQHRGTAGPSAQFCADMHREEGVTYCKDDFLPTVKTPTGLVGEEAAQQPAPRQHATLSNVSFKHPLTEIQNSVHSRRLNRLSQELSRSVFHWELPQEVPPTMPDSPAPNSSPAQEGQDTTAPTEACDPSAPTLLSHPQSEAPAEDRRSPCPSPIPPSRKKRGGISATLPERTSRSSRLRQEMLVLTEEVKAQKELVKLLQQALAEAQQEKLASSHFLAMSEEADEDGAEPAHRHCERQVAELSALVEAERGQREALERALAQRDAQVMELQEHARMMMEKNQAKQEVVLRLSQQLAACMDDPHRTVPNSMGDATFSQLQEEIHNLKDDIEAYKIQNKFLNSEIYQLTRLWRKSSEQEKSLMMKCAYLESRNCQTQGRYLGVLRNLQDSKQLDAGQQEVVKSLIKDTVDRDAKDVLKLDPIREYDEYGFKIVPDFEVEDVKLLAKIQALEVRTHNLLRRDQGEGVEGGVSARWAKYLSGRPSGGELAPSPELKALLRGGVPRDHRRRVWLWLVRARTRSLRECHPRRYHDMWEKSQATPHPAARQIQLDLHRTLTGNQRFSSPSSPATQQLHRVLLAFSWQNPTIGYCQGLNRLAALALLVLQDEEEAFWCLVAVVESIMPQEYYSKTLTASQVDQRVLKEMMAEKLPRLSAHLEQLQVDASHFTFNWFLVAFIESLPVHILLRVWDAFLYEGSKVLFRYALALFKYREEDILKIQDKVDMYQYLRFFTKTITDGRKLMSIAFSDMNPFPMRLLSGRRAANLERVQAELSELERIQQEYTAAQDAERAKRLDKDLDAAGSEDEDEV